jgi:hypothetical protein
MLCSSAIVVLLSSIDLVVNDEFGARGGRSFFSGPTRTLLHHFYRRDRRRCYWRHGGSASSTAMSDHIGRLPKVATASTDSWEGHCNF